MHIITFRLDSWHCRKSNSQFSCRCVSRITIPDRGPIMETRGDSEITALSDFTGDTEARIYGGPVFRIPSEILCYLVIVNSDRVRSIVFGAPLMPIDLQVVVPLRLIDLRESFIWRKVPKESLSSRLESLHLHVNTCFPEKTDLLAQRASRNGCARP